MIPKFLRPEVLPFVDVAIVPAVPEAPLSPVVDVVLVPRERDDRSDTAHGSACSSACGHCGGCTNGSRGNWTCADCGDTYWKGPDDSDSYCDGCRAQRDAWADALEIRMAKARLPEADRKKEIA